MDTRQDWSALDRLSGQFLDCMDLYHVANESESWADLDDFEYAMFEFLLFFDSD